MYYHLPVPHFWTFLISSDFRLDLEQSINIYQKLSVKIYVKNSSKVYSW